MAIDLFLNADDSARGARTFLNLARHDISRWALTGGVAIELHILPLGGKPVIRHLNDLDFVAASFDSIPETIGSELLLRHVHPQDPPGKTMLQGVDPETGVRIDVFRAYGGEMERTCPITIATLALERCHFRIWSQDMLASTGTWWKADPSLRNTPEISCDLSTWLQSTRSNEFGKNIGNLRAPKASLRLLYSCAG